MPYSEAEIIPAEPDPVCTGVGIEMESAIIPNALTIAGSDSGGGAGIQADLKSFSALNVYGASVITAVTAQNTRVVSSIHSIPIDVVAAQLHTVLDDIDIQAIKIGMLGSHEVIDAVASVLACYPDIPIVLDPVMVSKSGNHLLNNDAIFALKTKLINRACILTPNLPEAAALIGQKAPESLKGMYEILPSLHQLGSRYVLLKGGHLGAQKDAVDLFSDGNQILELRAPRISTKNTHGTGCTLSSAVAAFLAHGFDVEESVDRAKAFVSEAILTADQLNVGSGYGPLNHFSLLWGRSKLSKY